MPTPARTALNNQIIPDFAKQFKSGEILFVGKDRKWDYSHLFPSCSYKTLDIDPKIKPDIVADIEDSKLPDDSFDGVIMTGVWEYLKNSWLVIEEIYRILKPKGKVLICFPGSSYYEDKSKTLSLNGAIDKLFLFKITRINITYYKSSVPYYIYIYAEKCN